LFDQSSSTLISRCFENVSTYYKIFERQQIFDELVRYSRRFLKGSTEWSGC
jgi:hypothetical protein